MDRHDLQSLLTRHLTNHPDHDAVQARVVEAHDRVAARLDEEGRRELDDLVTALGDLRELAEQVALDVGNRAGTARRAARQDELAAEVAEKVATLLADPRLDRGARIGVLATVLRTLA